VGSVCGVWVMMVPFGAHSRVISYGGLLVFTFPFPFPLLSNKGSTLNSLTLEQGSLPADFLCGKKVRSRCTRL
jgi:hypothetical protein